MCRKFGSSKKQPTQKSKKATKTVQIKPEAPLLNFPPPNPVNHGSKNYPDDSYISDPLGDPVCDQTVTLTPTVINPPPNPHTFSTNYPASGSESSPPESSPPEFSPPESSPAEASASESSSHTEESAPPLN